MDNVGKHRKFGVMKLETRQHFVQEFDGDSLIDVEVDHTHFSLMPSLYRGEQAAINMAARLNRNQGAKFGYEYYAIKIEVLS